jgi:hypothetical protein
MAAALALILVLAIWGVSRHAANNTDSSSRSNWLLGISAALSVVVPIAALFVAIGPGIGSLGSRKEYVFIPPPQHPEVHMGTVLLFRNSRPQIERAESERLQQTLSILRRCEVNQLRVVGYASSAPFAKYDADRNLFLANARAQAVTDTLDKAGIVSKVEKWDNFCNSVEDRRIRDIYAAERRI